MEKSKIADYAWKGFTVLLSIIIVPCFVWIWDSEMTWSFGIQDG